MLYSTHLTASTLASPDTALNLAGGWIAILAGLVTGIALGLFFHKEEWLGGYASWPRRLLRLGHISFFGTGLLNILFAVSLSALKIEPHPIGSLAMLASTVAMPGVCTAAAFWKPARHLFFVPVLCLLIGTADIVYLCLNCY
jgi:hypothetical protein